MRAPIFTSISPAQQTVLTYSIDRRFTMLGALAKKIFGSSNDRRVKGYRPRVAAINALEPEIAALSDEALRARTDMLKAELAGGKSLDDILVPAFATVREAAKRVLGQRHFDVQMIGGIVLHESGIAEMKTGEGKTLVATLPVYLNALSGKGVHVVTVNDYLASRDAEWMGRVYRFLGLTVGTIVHGLDDEQRREAYASDITYGTNNEFGFDYLRDNMKYELGQLSQRGHNFAIVDEVDSILIDEARTPLIISGPVDDRSELYVSVDALMPHLEKEHYDLDEKQRQVSLTESGNEFIEDLLRGAGLLKEGDLYDAHNVSLVHHVNQALRAHTLFTLDKDYIVKNDEVVIIDEFTGRMMQGRRYSEGLHQALEAKERVTIQPENQTLASITFQNYFRLYSKLAGMTGTASTEADEFAEIYKLEVVDIPTNKEVERVDEDDEVYRTVDEKYAGIIAEIEKAHARHQPILVGTGSIEKSEHLADLLRKAGFKALDYSDLNALTDVYKAAREGKVTKTFAVLNAPSTSRRPTSSPRPACRGRSRSQRTWPGAAPTSSSAATSRCASPRSSPTFPRGPIARQGSRRSRRRSTSTAPRCWPPESRPTRRPVARRHFPAAFTSSAPSATNHAASTTSCAVAQAARAIPAARSSTSPFKTI